MSSSTNDARPAAFPELESNLINCPLRPFVGLRQPELSTIRVEQGTFSAHHFLIADFSKSAHLLRFPENKINLII
jgi:hypothetical protein